MNLKSVQEAVLARGRLVLREYDLCSFLAVIPDNPERPIYRRRYAQGERVRARDDFDSLRAAAEVWD